MLQNKGYQYVLLVVLLGALILVRVFEVALFYDPLRQYFQQENGLANFPSIDLPKLLLHLSYRYAMNSILTLAFLYVIFKEDNLVKFSGLLLLGFWILLLLLFSIVFYFFGEEQKLFLFYIRRFLIQPIFLIVFLPAFYFQKVMLKK